jgi:hypothetical protein
MSFRNTDEGETWFILNNIILYFLWIYSFLTKIYCTALYFAAWGATIVMRVKDTEPVIIVTMAKKKPKHRQSHQQENQDERINSDVNEEQDGSANSSGNWSYLKLILCLVE